MARTAINLYTVRELDEPLPTVLDRVAAADYDGVQLSGGLGATGTDAVRDRLEATGLTPTAPHVPIEDLETDLETLATWYASLGCRGIVVPYLDETCIESPAEIRATADRLATIADRVADYGLSLHYHNHAHEFVEIDGRWALDRLLGETPAIGLELDVGWAAVAGTDPVAVIRRFADRIDLVHAKDVELDPWAFSEIGRGDVPMAECLAAATDVEVDWLVYEHDEPIHPATSIERGATYLHDAL